LDGAQVADQKVVSGQILDEEVSEVQQRVKREKIEQGSVMDGRT